MQRKIFLGFVLMTLGFSGKTATSTSLVLNWFPEVEHGGFYAAETGGFFKAAGLDVKIQPGGVDVQNLPMVATGRADFAVSNADELLMARAEKLPVVALMAPMQISPRCIIVHEESGIKQFGDLKNMTLSMTSQAAFGMYLKKKFPLPNVTIVPPTGNVASFLVDPKLAVQGYVISEPYLIQKKGGKPKVLMVSDIGFNPYTSILVTSEKTLKEKPELVKKMLEASVQGWKKYLETPTATHELIRKLNPEMDKDILDYGYKEVKPLVMDSVAKKSGLGSMSLDRWKKLNDQLVEIGVIKAGSVKPEEAFRWAKK